MALLPLAEVRQLARENGLREVQHNETSRVVAFVSRDNVRFNVYYTTGTVGTYLLHPRQGKTQLFRRNVSLTLLHDIFGTPRIHTDFGYHRRQDGLASYRKRVKMMSGDWDDECSIEEEESAAKDQLEKLMEEKAALEKEINEVKGIIDDHERRREEKRKRKEEEKRRQEEELKRQKALAKKNAEQAMRNERGVCGLWVLRESDDFKKNFTDYASCVAVGTDGVHLCLYDNGSWAYSSGLPDGLHKLLHTRAMSHPQPDYVALGSMNRYFIRFKNGKFVWVGPQSLTDLLQNDNRRVKSVAFGEDFDDYFVVFEGGGYQYVGCPSGLQDKINARGKRGDLDRVTLGPEGEWSLWAKNGKAWWGGLSTALINKISSIQKKGDNITELLFGNDGYYFIRYK